MFTETSDPSWDEEFKVKVDNKLKEIDNHIPNLDVIPISDQEIDTEINKLKLRKAPGWDLLSSEHLRYGGEKLRFVIKWMMTEIIKSEIIPQHFKKGLIVPIPKAGKDKTCKDNNRGITLISILYKIFERIMISREETFLRSLMDEMQSAVQIKCSSLHSSFVVQEAINYHLNAGSTVYTAFLDTRKAFDTVWLNGLLFKLHEAGLNGKTWRLLKCCYTQFQCAVLIGGVPGKWFCTERGVHQGAPFSMWLYILFINNLLKELKASGYGANIGSLNVTCPSHADDIAIIALHKLGLNQLLGIASKYSKKWRYSYNMPKTECMIWGRDHDPQIEIIMNGYQIEGKAKSKHLGIALCNGYEHKMTDCKTRGTAARAILMAARGLGSVQVPTPPSVLSHLYWSVAVPKMTYGLDITPTDESQIEVLEKYHRQNAKIVQGLPVNTPTPAPLASIGWMCLRSFIEILRMMFMFRLLCMPNLTVYKKIMILRLNECFSGKSFRIVGPVYSMYTTVIKYGLHEKLKRCLELDNFGDISSWKVLIKKIVWRHETIKWKASCLMYNELTLYQDSVFEIKMHAWWMFVKARPDAFKKVSSVMALIQGSQPIGLQCNFGKGRCKICHTLLRDDPVHVLFRCPTLSEVRQTQVQLILNEMPYALRREITNMNDVQKTYLLLSALRCEYVPEWEPLYLRIADWVYHIYKARKTYYDENVSVE